MIIQMHTSAHFDRPWHPSTDLGAADAVPGVPRTPPWGVVDQPPKSQGILAKPAFSGYCILQGLQFISLSLSVWAELK